jgi:hypothetical protein
MVCIERSGPVKGGLGADLSTVDWLGRRHDFIPAREIDRRQVVSSPQDEQVPPALHLNSARVLILHMLVGQRSAAAHGDQSGVTLSGQDRHVSHPLLITRRSSRQALAPLRRPIDDVLPGRPLPLESD